MQWFSASLLGEGAAAKKLARQAVPGGQSASVLQVQNPGPVVELQKEGLGQGKVGEHGFPPAQSLKQATVPLVLV
jgi:hypothetical protein